jgi:hypothetical protein
MVLGRRDIDLPSYVTGALSAMRSDAGIGSWQLTWSPAMTRRAQDSANQCNDDAPGGNGIQGTVYEAVNDPQFDSDYETKAALVNWILEGMQDDSGDHPNADSVKNPDNRFLGCAWSQNCGNDHYFKCALAAVDNLVRVKRAPASTVAWKAPESEEWELNDSDLRNLVLDRRQVQFDPHPIAGSLLNEFRADNQLQWLGYSTPMIYDAYHDANTCKENIVSSTFESYTS